MSADEDPFYGFLVPKSKLDSRFFKISSRRETHLRLLKQIHLGVFFFCEVELKWAVEEKVGVRGTMGLIDRVDWKRNLARLHYCDGDFYMSNMFMKYF